MPVYPSPSQGRPLIALKRPECRLPRSQPSWPFPRPGVAPETPGSTPPFAASGSEHPRILRGFPTGAHDTRFGGSVDIASRPTQRCKPLAQIRGHLLWALCCTQFHAGATLQGRGPLHQFHHQFGKLGCTKPFEIGFVQCLLGHRGHSGGVPKIVSANSQRVTERSPSSRVIDFIEYLLCDLPNVDVALTWNAHKQKAPRDAGRKALVLFGIFWLRGPDPTESLTPLGGRGAVRSKL